MGFFADILFSAPQPYGLIIMCLFAGFVGWLIPYLFFTWYNYKNPKASLLAGLFCLLLTAQFGEDIIVGKQRSEYIDRQIAQLHEDKIFDAMFTHMPQTEEVLRQKLKENYQALQTANEDERNYMLAEIRHTVMQGFFGDFLNSTGNEDLYKYLQLSYPQIYALKKTPGLCVRYFLGKPDKAFTQQNEEWMDREEAIKYAVIVKSIRTPHYKEPQTREQVILNLVTAYREIKWDETELEKSDMLLSVEPVQGCNIALHMFEAFLHMGPEMGPRAYRFIMLDGNKYYRMMPAAQ